MGFCRDALGVYEARQDDQVLAQPLAHTCCIPGYIGYVTGSGLRDKPTNVAFFTDAIGNLSGLP